MLLPPRAAKGEIGRLGIGFIGFASYPFLSDLLRKYNARHPGVALRLEENVPSGQDLAFDRGDIDIGFTRRPSADRSSSYESRPLFREPLVVALPKTRKVKAKRIRIASNDRAVSPELEKAEAAAMMATSITVPSSHVPMLSHPKEVADLIEQAAAKTGNQ